MGEGWDIWAGGPYELIHGSVFMVYYLDDEIMWYEFYDLGGGGIIIYRKIDLFLYES